MLKYKKNILHQQSGFSVIELLVSTIVLCIAILAIFSMVSSQDKSFKAEDDIMTMSQNTRSSLEILLRELRMSGYKSLEDQFLEDLSGYIPSNYLPSVPTSVSLSSNECPIITEGDGTAPDMITIFTADVNECTLQSAAGSGAVTITIDPNSRGYTGSEKFKEDDIIRIGDHTEFAVITEKVSENKFHIDTDPSTSGIQGLAENHPLGEIIREINIISYTVFNEKNDPSCTYHEEGHPVLKRKHNEADFVEIVEDIEDFQIIPHSPPRYKIKLISRTPSKGNYIEGSSDQYKRIEILADFRMRNFLAPECLPPQTPTINSLTGLDSASPCNIQVTWTGITKDIDGEDFSSECSVTDYIVTYSNTPDTRFYTAYPGTATDCELDISAILRDPNNTTYYISILAVNCSGLSAYSTELTIDDTSNPSSITDLTTSVADHAITISWIGNPECDVAEYRLYRSMDSGTTYTLLTNDFLLEIGFTKTYTYIDENLTCGTYYYLVRAFDLTYESANSNICYESIIDSDPPASPTDFSYSISGTEATLYWTPSIDDPINLGQGDADVVSYTVYGLAEESQTVLENALPAGKSSATINTQGYTNLGILAIDLCGNTSPMATQPTDCQYNISASIDLSEGAELSDTVSLSGFAVSYEAEITRIDLSIDHGLWIPVEGISYWNYSWDTTTETNGSHIVTIRATDASGCFGFCSVTVNIQNEEESEDTTPPLIADVLQNPISDPMPADQEVEIRVSVTDTSGIFEVLLSTNFENLTMMEDPNSSNTYFGFIPAHKGNPVMYEITARDNSVNHNEAKSITYDYEQSIF